MSSYTYTKMILALGVLTMASCGEDPKLVEKRDKQKLEIANLKGEIALIDEKLKNLPPDVSSQLAEAKEVLGKQTAEVTRLEDEITELKNRKSSLQNESDAYRAKYQVK